MSALNPLTSNCVFVITSRNEQCGGELLCERWEALAESPRLPTAQQSARRVPREAVRADALLLALRPARQTDVRRSQGLIRPLLRGELRRLYARARIDPSSRAESRHIIYS